MWELQALPATSGTSAPPARAECHSLSAGAAWVRCQLTMGFMGFGGAFISGNLRDLGWQEMLGACCDR